MTYEYFSDKELGSKELSSEEIPVNIWNCIVDIYRQFINNCALAGNFPDECRDGRGVCCCSQAQLENILKGEVPDLIMPIDKVPSSQTSNSSTTNDFDWEDDFDPSDKKKEDDRKKVNIPDKYAILDFLQFLHKNIKDPEEIDYHEYFGHSHYCFANGDVFKSQFRESINTIFSRNGIVFYLDDDGQIKRSIPKSIAKIITDIRFNTGDERLNRLLEIAYSKFILPRPENRVESLEKIWDAFERLKTYFEENKKLSATQLIGVISVNNQLFSEFINSEFNELTKIGNNFQIRHFERDKIQLESSLHIDYFFYRMSCLIHLCVESLKNNK
jgi:hypothetical protein